MSTVVEQDKNKKVLVLIESPNKRDTLKRYFKELGYTHVIIEASKGHITQLADDKSSYWNTGIFPDKKFKANYKLMPEKATAIRQLKEAVPHYDIIYIMTDPDFEGFAIGYALKTELKITNFRRILLHEITKSALAKGINESVADIHMPEVETAQARQKVDKLIGYRLSPEARRHVQCPSVGRCQSAALVLVVDREEEILNFKPERYFDLFVKFSKGSTDFRAKFIGDSENNIDRITNPDYCDFVVRNCKDDNYKINNIVIKQGFENPKPPFTTSTYQQEVSKKLGISVKTAMDYAQKLFEGLSINGEHVALTTYLRTDSTDMSEEFKPVLQEYVRNKYGEKYYAPVRKGKKVDNAQEGHECFRIIDPEMTPEKLATYIHDDKLIKIYTIIWKRTVASSMASATTSNTEYLINNSEFRFLLRSKEYLFDGYRKVYNYKDDDDKEEVVKETFAKGELLQNASLDVSEEFTKPASRYKEATFIKELESKGIGRPSTFAKIVETVLSDTRGYCVVEDKCIVPTEKGIRLVHFLKEHFPELININYTAELEANLDKIAKGELKQLDFLQEFFDKLETAANKVSPQAQKATNIKVDKKCPKCGAPLVMRFSPKTGKNFLGCSKFPKCKHIENL